MGMSGGVENDWFIEVIINKDDANERVWRAYYGHEGTYWSFTYNQGANAVDMYESRTWASALESTYLRIGAYSSYYKQYRSYVRIGNIEEMFAGAPDPAVGGKTAHLKLHPYWWNSDSGPTHYVDTISCYSSTADLRADEATITNNNILSYTNTLTDSFSDAGDLNDQYFELTDDVTNNGYIIYRANDSSIIGGKRYSANQTAHGQVAEYIPPTTLAATTFITTDKTVGSEAYTISWNANASSPYYILQEDDNSLFTTPTDAYDGDDTSYQIPGNTNGNYYYRVNCYDFDVANSPNSSTINITVSTGGVLSAADTITDLGSEADVTAGSPNIYKVSSDADNDYLTVRVDLNDDILTTNITGYLFKILSATPESGLTYDGAKTDGRTKYAHTTAVRQGTTNIDMGFDITSSYDEGYYQFGWEAYDSLSNRGSGVITGDVIFIDHEAPTIIKVG